MSQLPPPNAVDGSPLQSLPIPCILAATPSLCAIPIFSLDLFLLSCHRLFVRPAVVTMTHPASSPYSRERPPNLNDANFSSSQAGGSALGPGETAGSSGEDLESGASTGESSNTAGGHVSLGAGNLRPYIRAIAELEADSLAAPRLTTETLMAHNHRSAHPSYPDGVEAWRRDGHPFPVVSIKPAISAASDSMRPARHPRSYATDRTAQSSLSSMAVCDMDHDINGAGTRFDDEVIAPSFYDAIGDFDIAS